MGAKFVEELVQSIIVLRLDQDVSHTQVIIPLVKIDTSSGFEDAFLVLLMLGVIVASFAAFSCKKGLLIRLSVCLCFIAFCLVVWVSVL